jgi:type II secretory pathway pseudopilin PulG
VNSPSRITNRDRDIMNALTILIDMYLAGQAQRGKRGRQGNSNLEAGYAMAALLVGIAIMTVMMTVAMPAWRQMVQREKEEELVFRGEQIAHSIGMFQKKFASAYPPSIDVLVEQKFLRKKYKDPVTNDDFVPLTQSQQQSNTPGGPAGGRGGQPGQPAQGQRGAPAPGAGPLGLVSSGSPGGAPAGGIIGVTSKSKETSIRLYKGRSHYNEWLFVYTPPPAAAGTATPGAPQRGNNPGQRGTGNPFGGNGPFPPGGGGPPGGGQRGGPGRPGGPGPGRNPNPGGTPFPFPQGPGPGR